MRTLPRFRVPSVRTVVPKLDVHSVDFRGVTRCHTEAGTGEGKGQNMTLKGDSQAAELERLRIASQVGSVDTIPKAQEV